MLFLKEKILIGTWKVSFEEELKKRGKGGSKAAHKSDQPGGPSLQGYMKEGTETSMECNYTKKTVPSTFSSSVAAALVLDYLRGQ